MTAGPTRRISGRSTSRNPNPMFSALSTELHAVLIEGAKTPDQDSNEYYVAQRLSTYSAAEAKDLLARLPSDVADLAIGINGNLPKIDSLEMDLIDFLLHYDKNRVLSIVGTVGVGKSTFIRYVLHNIRAECVSLHKFLPVIVDCLRIGTQEPKIQDIIYEVRRGLGETIKRISNDERFDLNGVKTLIDDFALENLTFVSSAHFVEFVNRLKRLCLGDAEPVLVFDNLDHLSPDFVPQFAELARAVHLTTGLCILTAMRPATHATQSELSAGNGAFYSFLIEVNPPDIRAVIRRRLRLAFEATKTKFAKLDGERPILISDPERSINSLCDKVLNSRTQEIFIRDLCNNNVRQALASFARFCRYRDLKHNLLFDVTSESPEVLHGNWFDELVDGLMIADFDFYSERRSPIANLFCFEKNGYADYCILYNVLCVLDWCGRPLANLQTVRSWLESYGYSWAAAQTALGHLLTRSLIYSPESEADLHRVRNVRLSRSGEYYLKILIEHPQYLLNAIFDVPLPHAKWHEGDAGGFPVKLHSIWELIEAVYAVESVMIEAMVGDRSRLAALGAIDASGFLTGRICAAAYKLANDARYGKPVSRRSTGKDYAAKISSMRANIADGQSKLRQELARQKLMPEQSIEEDVISQSLGQSNHLTLRVPTKLAPASKNVVTIEVDMKGFEEVQPLVAVWQAQTDDQSYGEIVELTRTSHHSLFNGRFSIGNVTSVVGFPESSVTLFSATDPICVAALRAARTLPVAE